MNNQELINKYENKLKDVQLKFGANFKTKVYEELLEELKQLDKPQPTKLKDVIVRIKELDIGARKVWLDEILNEMGSDYGTLKYKAGYEQGKLEGEWVGQQLKDADKIRQELNNPVVPQIVADYIKDAKYYEWDLDDVFDHIAEESEESEIYKWFYTLGNVDVFARAWLDGYEVEKEPKYTVKFKNIQSGTRYLKYDGVIEKWYFGINQDSNAARLCHTKKQLEEAGFGWVFDCPGVEVEEVEE